MVEPTGDVLDAEPQPAAQRGSRSGLLPRRRASSSSSWRASPNRYSTVPAPAPRTRAKCTCAGGDLEEGRDPDAQGAAFRTAQPQLEAPESRAGRERSRILRELAGRRIGPGADARLDVCREQGVEIQARSLECREARDLACSYAEDHPYVGAGERPARERLAARMGRGRCRQHERRKRGDPPAQRARSRPKPSASRNLRSASM